MAELHIKIAPEMIAQMCAIRNQPIPQHVLDQLGEEDKTEAERYNTELLLLHWHVKDATHAPQRDIAFATEDEANVFNDKLWYWITGNDEDSELGDDLEVVRCFKSDCHIYVG